MGHGIKRGSITSFTEATFAAIGECIYCGCSPDDDPSCVLTDEHIIPLALGGPWVFPKSSCKACEKITGAIEAKILRGGLRGFREFLQYPSRAAAGPESLPVFCVNGDDARRVEVAVEDYPIVLTLPHFVGPLIGPFAGRDIAPRTPWIKEIRVEPEKLAEEYGVRSCAIVGTDAFSLGRMLAKIGHAFAVAQLGLDGFLPLLRATILGDEGTGFLRFVGTMDEEPEVTQFTHGISLLSLGEAPNRLFVCRIRLFSRFGAPPYGVVVGYPPPDDPPNLEVSVPSNEEVSGSEGWRLRLELSRRD